METETAFVSEQAFTQEEFWRWVRQRPASDIHHYELVRGHIVMSPPAGMAHGGLGARLVVAIGLHVEENRLGRVFDASTGFELPTGDTLEPDVSFVSAARLAANPPANPDRFARVVPTLVVEVLSPSTARRDRGEKRAIYAHSGVEEYWLVDPRRREVVVHLLAAGELVPQGSRRSGLIGSQALPGLQLTVEALFRD